MAHPRYTLMIREAQRRRHIEFLRTLRQAHQYDFTATTKVSYEKGDEGAHLLDVHISFAGRGQISAVGHKARKRGLEIYRQIHQEIYGFKPSPSEVRGKFEQIYRVAEPSSQATITIIEHIYRGKQFYPKRHFTRHIPIAELLN